MISKFHRFHGYGSLRFVYRSGKTVRGPLTSVKFMLNPKRSSYRLAVVVSKKVHKSAVVRNRIRRRLYEAVRRLEPEFKGSYDIVYTVFHEQVADLSATDLEHMVQTQLSEAGIIDPINPS